jgi:hypothetical protein
MKLFVLSFAVCITAASVSAQSASPTPLSATPPTDATHNVAPSFVVARPGAPQIKAAEPAISPAAVSTAPGAGAVPATQPPGQMIPAASSSITVDAHIESRSIDSSSVGEVHLKPLYISTIHLPEAVTSVAVGAPTLFTAEHVENEPKLVFVSPTTHDKAESNLLVALADGKTISLKLMSSGTSADYDVDFVVDYTQAMDLLAFAGPLETGIGPSPSSSAAPLTAPSVTSYPVRVRASAQTVRPVSVIDAALASQAEIATPFWLTADDLLKMDKANANATRKIAASLGRVVQVGDTMMVTYSVLNVGREWAQVLIPQIQLGNPVQKKPSKKGILASTVSIQDYRQNVVKLAPGERLDGVVQFSRPGFKQSRETLLLQIATADAVDHPVMVPLPFVAPGF